MIKENLIAFYFVGNFYDLLQFRIESGDETLRDHFKHCNKNAIYTSPRIQNEIIDICGTTLREMILKDARLAST